MPLNPNWTSSEWRDRFYIKLNTLQDCLNNVFAQGKFSMILFKISVSPFLLGEHTVWNSIKKIPIRSCLSPYHYIWYHYVEKICSFNACEAYEMAAKGWKISATFHCDRKPHFRVIELPGLKMGKKNQNSAARLGRRWPKTAVKHWYSLTPFSVSQNVFRHNKGCENDYFIYLFIHSVVVATQMIKKRQLATHTLITF